MSALLLEIGTEEIPARFMPPVLGALKDKATTLLSEAGIDAGEITTCGTPRRIALLVDNVVPMQKDRVREVLGPARRVAFSEDGKPTKAAEGFARGQGIDVSALQTRATEKGEYVCAVFDEKGRPAAEVLTELLPGLITSLSFPKSMRWNETDFRFARPIRWIVALLDDKVIPFEISGVTAGRLTRGHRFLSSGEITLDHARSYREALKVESVIVDPAERTEIIYREVAQLAADAGGRVIDDTELLVTVTHIVEYPVPVRGGFPADYLQLPREVLVNCMRGHQKYFAVEDSSGTLMPYFITVSNTRAKDMDVVRAGNERVLKARLYDARFFFEEDMKRPLAERVADLRRVTWQEKLGSVYDKMERVRAIALYLADVIPGADRSALERAASLCKADLTTGMVGEFPELQGVMGREYALRQGEPRAVAAAIHEHYLPRFAGDKLPETPEGKALAVADRIDSIAGCFSVGLVPSGSEDPYALRRQAIGVIHILNESGPHSLIDLIWKALDVLGDKVPDKYRVKQEIVDFFRGRYYNLLTADGARYDSVEAVLAAGLDDLFDVKVRLDALERFRSEEGSTAFITAVKRVNNIISKGADFPVEESLFREDAEKTLWREFNRVRERAGGLVPFETLHAYGALVPFINGFFDNVLVMDKDERIKNNRLGLLNEISATASAVASFSKLVE